MIEDLSLLQSSLALSFSSGARHPEAWSDAGAMERARAKVANEHGTAGIDADPRSILAAIADFRKTGRPQGFRDLKYVCLGVGAIDSQGWCILSDEGLRTQVGKLAESQTAKHRRLRCFQALLSAYFTFPLNAKGTSEEAKNGWNSLRAWLRSQCHSLFRTLDHKPPWCEALERHFELLSDRPCERFGKSLLAGDHSGFKDARDSLSIPDDSWMVEETVVAQMVAAAALQDEVFKTALPHLLDLALGRSGMSIGEALKIRCVAILVSRYATCSARPEQPGLRDAATTHIGNPWLRRAQWDAWVCKGGKADDQAREMVFGWLKGRLITDFFELLSVDGINDRRRLTYWLRFAPFVEDMWFALGVSAQSKHGAQFEDFRERAKGRLLNLEGTTADNNAFVMRIGAYLAVEFGASGNAFFLFKWDELRPSMLKALTSGKVKASVWINELKNETWVAKLRHVDSPVALKSWEQKFDDKLNRLIGKEPEKRPACVPDLEKGLIQANVGAADLRERGGALWVLTEERNSALARQLRALGFGFRPGRGWFKE
jgi:hypothetical protein